MEQASFQSSSEAGKRFEGGSVSQINGQRVPDTRGQECKWVLTKRFQIGFSEFSEAFRERIGENETADRYKET